MSEQMAANRRATAGEVAAKRAELRALASRHRFGAIAVAAEGMTIVRTDDPGHRDLARFAGEASRLVGAYVQVITDDVPAASVPTKPLFVSPAELLAGLARELEAIEQLAAPGRAAWDADELLRLAIERHWSTAGR